MEQKLAELTDKIYQEGVQKGEQEASKIIDEAKGKAASITDDAKKEAEKILADAQARAEEQKRNSASEIKLSGRQAVDAIKQQIVDAIIAKMVDAPIGEALDNPDTIKDLITTVVGNWNAGSGQTLSLQALLPANKQQDLEKSLTSSLSKLLKSGLSLSFDKGVKGGFQIGPQDGTYKISLTDEDFREFFKEYLRPKTRSILYEE